MKKVASEANDTVSNLFHKKAGFIYNVFHCRGRKMDGMNMDAMMESPLLGLEDLGVYQGAIRGDYHCVRVLEWERARWLIWMRIDEKHNTER